VRKVSILLAALIAVGLATSAVMGSGPVPSWDLVADGAYQAAWGGDGSIVFVPAMTRLRAPQTDQTELEVTQAGGGLALQDTEGPPVSQEMADERRAFVHRLSPSDSPQIALDPTGRSGGWSLTVGESKRYLQSISDRLDTLMVSPSGEMYTTRDERGHLAFRDVDGNPVELAGLPGHVLESACRVAWSADATAVYLANPTGLGAEIWYAPLQGQAQMLAVVDQFDGFVGTTPSGVLVHRCGIALDEVTPTGTRTVLRLTFGDLPWAVAPDGRYVLMLDQTVTLVDLGSGKALSLQMPEGYELCPPRGWPGPTSSEIAVYACGADPSDTILLLYTETVSGKFNLTQIITPPSEDLCFDYNVNPAVIAPGVLSVVLTGRSEFLKGSAEGIGTWLVTLHGEGRP